MTRKGQIGPDNQFTLDKCPSCDIIAVLATANFRRLL